MDGTFKTYTSLLENLNQAYLVFLIFGQWNKMKTSFAQISSFKV